MINQTRNIFNSSQCEISILVIICCMIITNLSLKYRGEWNVIGVVATILGGVVLLGLIVWTALKLVGQKAVKEMSAKSRLTIEMISRLLFLFWIYITGGVIFAIIWAVFIIWDGIRSLSKLNS